MRAITVLFSGEFRNLYWQFETPPNIGDYIVINKETYIVINRVWNTDSCQLDIHVRIQND